MGEGLWSAISPVALSGYPTPFLESDSSHSSYPTESCKIVKKIGRISRILPARHFAKSDSRTNKESKMYFIIAPSATSMDVLVYAPCWRQETIWGKFDVNYLQTEIRIKGKFSDHGNKQSQGNKILPLSNHSELPDRISIISCQSPQISLQEWTTPPLTLNTFLHSFLSKETNSFLSDQIMFHALLHFIDLE